MKFLFRQISVKITKFAPHYHIPSNFFLNHYNMKRSITLADPEDIRQNLLPVTFTRPVADLRIGILTLRQKWERRLQGVYGYQTVDYLAKKFPEPESSDVAVDKFDFSLRISGDICADDTLAAFVNSLLPGTLLNDSDGRFIAFCGPQGSEPVETVTYPHDVTRVAMLYDIFTLNGQEIERDFRLITQGRESEPLSDTCKVVGPRDRIFIEPGASCECAMINTTAGSVYIGSDATVMEGAMIRAPFAALEHSQVNMGTRIYGATTLGPWCKVGGELNNVVMIGYSNKAHDGFLGNAVIGQWCNIGAGSNASNLKNDYTEIKLWNYAQRRFARTGLQFCGLIMGDHSKAGINTMFNTATVFGVGVNFHGSGYPRNFTASFSEGSNTGMSDLSLDKFLATAARVMARRGITLTDVDRDIYAAVREIAETYK